MKVLVVDDSHRTLAEIAEILKKNDFVVETADNGAIITWLGSDELNKLREKSRQPVEKAEDLDEERTDIFNDKVFGKLVDYTGLRLSSELIRKFDESKDSDWLDKGDLAKARFEIAFEEVKVPIEVHVYIHVNWF